MTMPNKGYIASAISRYVVGRTSRNGIVLCMTAPFIVVSICVLIGVYWFPTLVFAVSLLFLGIPPIVYMSTAFAFPIIVSKVHRKGSKDNIATFRLIAVSILMDTCLLIIVIWFAWPRMMRELWIAVGV